MRPCMNNTLGSVSPRWSATASSSGTVSETSASLNGPDASVSSEPSTTIGVELRVTDRDVQAHRQIAGAARPRSPRTASSHSSLRNFATA